MSALMERLLRAPRGLADGIALHLEVCAPKQTLARRPEIRCPVPGLLHEQARARQGGGGGIRAAVGSGQFEPLISSISNFLAALAISRSEEHTSELQSLMRISYAVFCLKKKKKIDKQIMK